MAKRKERETPREGTVCTRAYKGKRYTMTVVARGSDFGFRVGGEVFRTPTAAAKSVTGTEVNGWMFWGLDRA